MISRSFLGAACTCLAVVSVSAEAALLSRLGGLAYYDNVSNLTWLADANYAQTSGYDADGRLNHAAAVLWAADLTVGGNDNWRLPTTLQPDPSCESELVRGSGGFGCTGSELGDLYYNALGNIARDSVSDPYNSGPFSNVQTSYWTETGVDSRPGLEAWYFDMNIGSQGNSGVTIGYSAWAVQTGDVSAVPLPAAAWLFGSGLVGLAGLARRKVSK